MEQLAKPLTDSERHASRQALNKLHPGNRFRLMAGLSMLPEWVFKDTMPEPAKQPLKSEKPA